MIVVIVILLSDSIIIDVASTGMHIVLVVGIATAIITHALMGNPGVGLRKGGE